MSYAAFAHRKNKHIYHPALFLIRVKYTAQCFFDSHKIDSHPALIIERPAGAVCVACATHKGKKGRGLLHIPLLVKSRRFCRFCQFKPGFCEFLTKNLFKMRYYAIFCYFLTVFTMKKATSAAVRRLHEGEKAVSFPIYNAGHAPPFSSNE